MTVDLTILTAQESAGHAADDILTAIENLTGSAHADTLTGDAGNNTLAGGAGADALDGGTGSDSASYASSTAGVRVNLTLPTAQVSSGHAAGDILAGIESLTGSAHADTLTGDAGNNWLAGGAAGDAIHGGDGIDTANYVSSSAGVTVNLATGAASGGEATGDTFTGIENLNGSAHADTLTGNASDNVLMGWLGSDVMSGGAGFDAFVFNTALGAANIDQITDFSVADDAIRIDNAVFTALTATGTLTAAAFRPGAAAGDADDRIIYNSTNGALYYDADGTGATGQVQFATLTSSPTGVTNADFVVI